MTLNNDPWIRALAYCVVNEVAFREVVQVGVHVVISTMVSVGINTGNGLLADVSFEGDSVVATSVAENVDAVLPDRGFAAPTCEPTSLVGVVAPFSADLQGGHCQDSYHWYPNQRKLCSASHISCHARNSIPTV